MSLASEDSDPTSLRVRTSWDPYEVWCTRVRAERVGAGPVATMAQSLVDGRTLRPDTTDRSRSRASRARAIPFIAWPVLLFALVLGLNRELVGMFRLDLITVAFGAMTPAARVAHVVLGISVIYVVVMAWRLAKDRRKG